MILEFKDKQYICIDDISVLRMLDNGNGVCVVGGEKIILKPDEFDTVEQAFIWMHKSQMYSDDMKKIRFVKRED